MREVVIVDAVRTPVGRRNGALSSMHSADLLAVPFKALFDRTGMDPAQVGQVVGGCVSQIGQQAFNITRTAWLTAGLPLKSPLPRSTLSVVRANKRSTSPMHSSQLALSIVPLLVALKL